VLHHGVCPASWDRASEYDRQKSPHCEERVAGVRKPSLKVHSPLSVRQRLRSVKLRAGAETSQVECADGQGRRGDEPLICGEKWAVQRLG
jgi:hypothetical protein